METLPYIVIISIFGRLCKLLERIRSVIFGPYISRTVSPNVLEPTFDGF